MMGIQLQLILVTCIVHLVLTCEPPTTDAPIEDEPIEDEPTTPDADESTQKIVPPKPEKIDEFYNYQEPVDEFSHYKPNIIYEWKRVIEAYDVKDIKFLRYLCTKVHELAGWGAVKVINNFIMDQAVIVYKNPMYFPTDTKFLQYVTDQPQTFENNETMDHFYITEGLKEDCIFYLIPTDTHKLNAFNLGHHVCGVHRALKESFTSGGFSPIVDLDLDTHRQQNSSAPDEHHLSSAATDSPPESVLASASNSGAGDYDSSADSSPDLILPDSAPNTSVEYDLSESGPKPVLKMSVHGPLEDLYVKFYGNDPWVERCWTPLREFHSDEDEEKMKMVCIEYYKLRRKGSPLKPQQLLVDFNKQLLKFRTKASYRSAHIDVLWCGINDTNAVDIEDMRHFYITRGSGVDCVFYLTPTDKTAMEFYLEEHVCKNSATVQKWNKKKANKGKDGKANRAKKRSSESIEEVDDDNTASDEEFTSSRENKTPEREADDDSSAEKVTKANKRNKVAQRADKDQKSSDETSEGAISDERARKVQHSEANEDAAENKKRKPTLLKSKTSKDERVENGKKKKLNGTTSSVSNKTSENAVQRKASKLKTSNKSENNVKRNATGKAKKNNTD